MQGEPPNERWWTAVAGGVFALLLIGAAVGVALLPVRSPIGDRPDCGTAFFMTDGPRSCDGRNTPYQIAAVVLFALGVCALVGAARTRDQ